MAFKKVKLNYQPAVKSFVPKETISISNAYLEKLDFHWPKITKDYIIDLINYMKKIMYI